MIKNLLHFTIMLILFSCSNGMPDLQGQDSCGSPLRPTDDSGKQKLMSQFAEALSAAVYENQELREFIKSEASKQFDKNHDILWLKVRDARIGEATFRELLGKKSSEAFISQIEDEIPLLNILFPKIAMFGISPDNYDSSDEELPVALSGESYNALYYNGKCTDQLQKGQIPAFPVLVVNENSRVVVNRQTRGSAPSFSFKSPAFDGTAHYGTTGTQSADAGADLVGNKAIAAFEHFYADDSGPHSAALQRDYIYYGITPEKTSGELNRSTSEYISFIEVSPTSYFIISDHQKISPQDDPLIKDCRASRKKRDFTEEELLDKLWTKGAYNFRVEIQKSTDEQPQIIYLPVKPDEIWNFNLKRSYRHSTLFRHSKYTYSINPQDFTAKRYQLSPYQLSLGKWNIAEESLYRQVTFQEEDDEGAVITSTTSYEIIKVKSSKFEGDFKLELGLGKDDKLGGEVYTEVSASNTTKESGSRTVSRKEKSDDLGSVVIYFYDPIIEKKLSTDAYQMRTYNTEHITFGITAY